MVFFSIGPTDLCARVEPTAASDVGETMGFTLNMDKMHLIDPATDVVA